MRLEPLFHSNCKIFVHIFFSVYLFAFCLSIRKDSLMQPLPRQAMLDCRYPLAHNVWFPHVYVGKQVTLSSFYLL